MLPWAFTQSLHATERQRAHSENDLHVIACEVTSVIVCLFVRGVWTADAFEMLFLRTSELHNRVTSSSVESQSVETQYDF